MTVSDEKARLRREMKIARAQLSENDRHRAALALCEVLRDFLSERSERSIGVYLALASEISLDPLIRILLAAGIEVGAPRLDLERDTMAFFRLASLEDVTVGAWNVREPRGEEMAVPSLVLVPGLAFDMNGHRLGMGAGWYDRTLTSGITTIGVCFDWQIVPRVPVEEHDRKMDWVFSDKRRLGSF